MHTSRNNWKCNCPSCLSVIQRRRSGLLLALLCLGLVLIASIMTLAQTAPSTGVDVIKLDQTKPDPDSSICLYHPETLMKSDPSGRLVFIHHTTYGWPQAWPAIDLIRSEWPSGNPDRQAQAVVAAVQYSIYVRYKLDESKRLKILAYFPDAKVGDVPDITLHEAVRQFLWSGNLQTRSSMRHWLRQVVESRTNIDCNPWYPYKR